MLLKPVRHGVGQAVFEHVNGAAAFQIDDNGAVAVAFAPGPIVEADDFRWRIRGCCETSHASEHDVATARHALTPELPSTGRPATGEPSLCLAGCQPERP